MGRWIVGIVALMALVWGGQALAEPAAAVGTVTGVVKDPSGKVLADVPVQLMNPDEEVGRAPAGPGRGAGAGGGAKGKRTKTDGEGRFTLANVPVGTYSLVIGDKLWGTKIVTVVVNEGKTVTRNETLTPRKPNVF